MPQHRADRIRWLATGVPTLPDELDWLAPAELARVAPLRFTKRRLEVLVRRWAGKQAVTAELARSTDRAALQHVEILNRDSGAPYVVVEGAVLPLDISLSDRSGWAVCLLGRREPDQAIGVDLEVVEPRSGFLIEDFFSAAERRHLAGLSEAEHRVRANTIWSAKEAALKVLHIGLGEDTRAVEVTVGDEPSEDGWHRLQVTHRAEAVYPGWWRREGVFLITIVTRRPTAPPDPLPAGQDLATAVPEHRWLAQPLVSPRLPSS